MRKVAVVGGGAAGLMATITAAGAGACVTLLERNDKLGRKIYITGKGRCNCTNDCSLEEFLREVPENPRFLYSALHGLMPQDFMALLAENGCPVTVERGRRVFPASGKASDVTRALEQLALRAGVTIRLNARVRSLNTADGHVTGLTLESGETLQADAVVLATGGLSYPGTGSTGDGYRFAEETGHELIPRTPSLSAFDTADDWPKRLQGLSLKNVRLTLRQGGKTLYDEMGEMLFTHFGVSGPLVLEMSCHLRGGVTGADVRINLKPALDAAQLDQRLQRELSGQSRRSLSNALCALLPSRLAAVFPGICGVDGSRQCGQISREERKRLAEGLQALPVRLLRFRPVEEAIVTRGGVSVKDINAATMASKKMDGLYFAGELIDVDAHTGGYNLHIAWATGRLAGQSAARASGGPSAN